jgi:hypothetical protein
MKEAQIFVVAYGNIPIRFFSLPTGAQIPRDDIALALGCPSEDLGSSELMAQAAIGTAAAKYGPAGARLLKWLNKTIKRDGWGLTPEGIESGCVCLMLVPVKSASGKLLRLKEEVGLTARGVEYFKRTLAVPPHATRQ